MPDLERFSRRGWEIVRLSSPSLAVEVVPGLGATICSVRRLADDLELLHQSPWGLPQRGAPQLGGTAEVLRHDQDPGGWQSLFPNGGDSVVVNGADQGFDGEARIAPFDIDDTADIADTARTSDAAGTGAVDSPGQGFAAATLRLTTRLRRSPVQLTKIITVDGDSVTVTETVRSAGAADLEVMWGSRLRFGAPLISKDAEVESTAGLVHPDATVLYDVDYDDATPWPRTPSARGMINLRYLPEHGSENRLAYLTDLTSGSVSVTNSTVDCRATVEWDSEIWPFLWYALEAGDTDEHPWFGNGYFLSLTPSSSWPAHGLHDARRISSSTVWLEPGVERSATVTLRVGPAS
jgi:hypothetical protein